MPRLGLWSPRLSCDRIDHRDRCDASALGGIERHAIPSPRRAGRTCRRRPCRAQARLGPVQHPRPYRRRRVGGMWDHGGARRDLSASEEDDEIAIGRANFPAMIREGGGLHPDPRLQKALQRFMAPLVAASDRAHLPWTMALTTPSPSRRLSRSRRVPRTRGTRRRRTRRRTAPRRRHRWRRSAGDHASGGGCSGE